MASYTDNIPTFNPYVQTIPVDDMIKVGMYKQQKYDEGIQKIQTNIDNIAGLDVIRDVDKAYLQSKLNQLGNNLTTVAAGDFSNFQLVNSVNGMTNQIARDPNVVNAISSSKTYRKGLEDMSAANKEGKGSPSNDWLFKTDASDWLNSQDVNKSFSGGYKPYTNYEKNAQEVIKGLVKNSTGQDVAFEKDAKGNLIILDAMTRTKISGITPERIQSALMVGLSPGDFQQMQIDGRYNYSGSKPEQFVGDINKSYKESYDKIKIQRDMTANAMDTASSASAKIELKKQVESFDKTLKGLSDEYGSVSKTFAQGDVESAKARLHTTKWISNFSQTFASQDVLQEYVTSPYQQPDQWRKSQAMEYDKWSRTFEQTERFKKADLYYKDKEDKRADRKLKLEEDAATGANDYGAVPVAVPQNELPIVTLGKVNDQIKADAKFVSDQEADIMKTYGKEGDTLWLNQQRVKWQSNPNSVDAQIAAHFEVVDPKIRKITANSMMITDINNKLDEKYGKIEDYIPTGSKPVTVTFPSGSYTYTPKDFVEFNDKIKNYVTMTSGGNYGTGGGAPSIQYNDKKAKSELSDKEYYLYQSYKNQKDGTQKTLVNNIQYYNANVNKPYVEILKKRNDDTAEIVKERVVAMQGLAHGVPLNNEAQKTSFGNALIGFAKLAESQDGGLPNSPGLDVAELKEIGASVQNGSIEVVEGTDYAPARYRLTVANKDKTQTFTVPAEAYNSVFGKRFEPSPEIAAIRDLQAQQIRTGTGTTAMDGKKTNMNNAFMGRTLNFINVQNYGVSGNLVTGQNGLSQLRINVTDPITKEVVEDVGYPNFMINANQVDTAIKGLTDETIFILLHNRQPTAAELKQIKQASQNPY
jgi:hypothetical protein